MAEVLQPEVVDAGSEPKPNKNRRSLVRYKIRRLPPEARRELEARFAADNFGSFEDLSHWLEQAHGQRIAASSLGNYYKNNFDPVLKAVKIATAQAAEIVRLTAGDDERMSAALLRLVQTAIFDLLVELQRSRQSIARMPAALKRGAKMAKGRSRGRSENGELPGEPTGSEDRPSRVEIAAIAALGKVTATVSKAIIDFQRWREEMHAKLNEQIAATTAKVSDAAREAGISPEVEKTIRDALMEIKV